MTDELTKPIEQPSVMDALPPSAQEEIQKVLEKSLMEQKRENDALRARIKAIEEKETKFADIEAQHAAKYKQLEDELKKSESIIDSFAELQIDTRRLNSMEEIAKANGVAPDYLKMTLEKNKDEYLRTIINRRNAIMEEAILRLQDKELDPTGGKIIENLQRAVTFFYDHKTMQEFDTDAIKKYPEQRQILFETFNQLVAWRKEEADVVNISIKTCDGVVWYAMKEFKDKIENKKKAVAVNPEEEIAKITERVAQEDGNNANLEAKIDATNKKVDGFFEKFGKWLESNSAPISTASVPNLDDESDDEELTAKIKPKPKK